MLSYWRALPGPKVLLWCYLIWYAFVVVRYFDPSPTLWATSLGLSAIIGTGLYVSTAYAGAERRQLGFWPVFRFYLMPFCVSSFAALIKEHHFVLIFPPSLAENLTAVAACGLFSAFVAGSKKLSKRLPVSTSLTSLPKQSLPPGPTPPALTPP